MGIAVTYCRDMDGRDVHAGDEAVCLALPEEQPCIARILAVLAGNRVRVDNGLTQKNVPAASCILRSK